MCYYSRLKFMVNTYILQLLGIILCVLLEERMKYFILSGAFYDSNSQPTSQHNLQPIGRRLYATVTLCMNTFK